jgi:hypothetical protein
MPSVLGYSTGEILERICGRLAWPPQHSSDFCWLWVGAYGGTGQPQLKLNRDSRRRTITVARYLFEVEFQAPIPDGSQLRRSCANLACVSPFHGYVCEPGERRRDYLRRMQQEEEANA